MADQKRFRFEMGGRSCRLDLALDREQLALVAEQIATILENPNVQVSLTLEGTLRDITRK